MLDGVNDDPVRLRHRRSTPVTATSRRDPRDAAPGHRHPGGRDTVVAVAAEFAMAAVLLALRRVCCTTPTIGSARRSRLPSPAHVLTFMVRLPDNLDGGDASHPREISTTPSRIGSTDAPRRRALPGVEAASRRRSIHPSAATWGNGFVPEGRGPLPAGATNPVVFAARRSRGIFERWAMPGCSKAGRCFERPTSPRHPRRRRERVLRAHLLARRRAVAANASGRLSRRGPVDHGGGRRVDVRHFGLGGPMRQDLSSDGGDAFHP